MKKALALLICVFACGTVALGDGYDYFRNSRYPGGLREDVSLDRVQQEGGSAGAYLRRVVHWWPKKGVDIVEVPEGVPLRTWTFQTTEDERTLEMGYLAKWRDDSLQGKKQFKAHLLGFRGIGSEIGNPFNPRPHSSEKKPKDHWCPSVVLRLEDGRKRCFDGDSFCDADQEYILKLYVEEMTRVHDTLVDINYKTQSSGDDTPRPELRKRGTFRTIGELYVPGSFLVDSRHYSVDAGSQSPIGGFSPWVSAADKEGTTQYRAATMGVFEDFWAYLEYAGMYMFGWNERGMPNRYYVEVPGTMRDGFGEIGGYAGGGGGGCAIRGAGWDLLFHEWGHGPGGTWGDWGIGGGETCSDSYPPAVKPAGTTKVQHQVDRPYKNLYHGGYPGCLIPTTIGDDPNWGYAFIGPISKLACKEDKTPFHTIARLGFLRGMWTKEDAIRGMGDTIAQIGSRLAEFDYEMQAGFRKMYAAPVRQFLYCLDREEGLYRCNMAQAPEPFGSNHILLMAQPGAKKITVDFRGHHDPATHADWRACIVTVDDMGRCRYSPLWNKGTMSMEIKDGDQRHWLAVTATPTALPVGMRGLSLTKIYEGDYAYRYPYDVKLTGCRPSGPNLGIGTNANWDLIGPDYYTTKVIDGGPRGMYFDWPHPEDTPQYARMKERLESLIERYPAFAKQLVDPKATKSYGWLHNRMITGGLLQATRAKYLLKGAVGKRHPNGGGWVARGCRVDPTAYVGPNCMVLDGAQVLDNAILEDNSIVSGKDVIVKDNARLYGGAVVCGAAEVSGFARVSRNISNRKVHQDQRNVDGVMVPEYKPYPDAPIKRDTPERRTYCYLGGYAGLEANYGMDRPETVLLEDLFQERGQPFGDLLDYSGVMTGRPGFVVDGEHRGYTFNGRGQYGELGPMVADYGQITVDVALKLEGGGERTIFDFGSSEDNCYKLVAGPSGAISLVTIVDGKKEALTAAAPAKGKWTTVRVEIDGRTMAILYDGKKVASRQSTFRPADVFPGGCDKRNFIAATRDGKNCFQGEIDYVRLYSTVYDDFAKEGIVPEVSSRRVDESFFDRFDEFHELNAQRLAEWRTSGKKLAIDDSRLTTWLRQTEEYKEKYEELGESATGDLKQQHEAAREKHEERCNQLREQFDARPEVADRNAKVREIDERMNKLRRQLDENNTALNDARKTMEEARQAVREIENTARKAVQEQTEELNKRLGELNKKHHELVEAARAGDEQFQAALGAEEAYRKQIAELPKDTPQYKRESMHRKLGKLGGKRHRHSMRIEQAPNVLASRERVDSLRNKINGIQRAAIESAPGYRKAQSTLKVLETAYRELERGRHDDPRLKAMYAERKQHDPRYDREAFVREGAKKEADAVKKLEVAIKQQHERVQMLHNADEFYGIDAWGSGTFERALEAYAKQFRPFSITEDETTLRSVLSIQQSKWATEVNWEDTKKDREKLAPHELQWLKRMKPWEFE